MIQGTLFFLMKPDYLCKNENTGVFDVKCTPTDFCDFTTDKAIKEFKIVKNSINYIKNNWVEQMSLHCKQSKL